jgi:hypothetical protein
MNTRGMTPMAHHAMCLAAGGYWQLADAMELIEQHQLDPTVSAIAHPFSSKTCIGRANESFHESCDNCAGTGYVECDMGHDHDCPDCDGEGGTSIHEFTWQTLDGDDVDADAFVKSGGYFTLTDARQLVAQYERLINFLQVAA